MVSKKTLYYGVCGYKSGYHDGCYCLYVILDISICASLSEVILCPSALFYLQNWSSRFLRNAGTYVPNYTMFSSQKKLIFYT